MQSSNTIQRRQLIRDWAKVIGFGALIFLTVYLWSIIYGSPDANADAYIQFDAPWENSQLPNSTFTFGDIGAGMIFIIGAIVLCAFNILFINLWKILRRCWLPMLLLACYGSPDVDAAEQPQWRVIEGNAHLIYPKIALAERVTSKVVGQAVVNKYPDGHAKLAYPDYEGIVWPALEVCDATTWSFSPVYIPEATEIYYIERDGKTIKLIDFTYHDARLPERTIRDAIDVPLSPAKLISTSRFQIIKAPVGVTIVANDQEYAVTESFIAESITLGRDLRLERPTAGVGSEIRAYGFYYYSAGVFRTVFYLTNNFLDCEWVDPELTVRGAPYIKDTFIQKSSPTTDQRNNANGWIFLSGNAASGWSEVLIQFDPIWLNLSSYLPADWQISQATLSLFQTYLGTIGTHEAYLHFPVGKEWDNSLPFNWNSAGEIRAVSGPPKAVVALGSQGASDTISNVTFTEKMDAWFRGAANWREGIILSSTYTGAVDNRTWWAGIESATNKPTLQVFVTPRSATQRATLAQLNEATVYLQANAGVTLAQLNNEIAGVSDVVRSKLDQYFITWNPVNANTLLDTTQTVIITGRSAYPSKANFAVTVNRGNSTAPTAPPVWGHNTYQASGISYATVADTILSASIERHFLTFPMGPYQTRGVYSIISESKRGSDLFISMLGSITHGPTAEIDTGALALQATLTAGVAGINSNVTRSALMNGEWAASIISTATRNRVKTGFIGNPYDTFIPIGVPILVMKKKIDNAGAITYKIHVIDYHNNSTIEAAIIEDTTSAGNFASAVSTYGLAGYVNLVTPVFRQ